MKFLPAALLLAAAFGFGQGPAPAPARKTAITSPNKTTPPAVKKPAAQAAASQENGAKAATEPEITMARPKAGPVSLMKVEEVRPGMKAIAWTVIQGTESEPLPIEILGVWKNASGPKQDIILGRVGGKAVKTFVAGGMSGSPVYINGKLVGALSSRLGAFTLEPICGITPIESMLEIKDYDASRPAAPTTPQRASAVPGEFLQNASIGTAGQMLVPIETPLTLSGFSPEVLRQFAPFFQEMGVTAVQGGAAGTVQSAKPEPGWQTALQPGDAIAPILVSGDMSVASLGTVTHNDGKNVLAFGHQFFNLGPVSMPMAKGEVLLTLGSTFQPTKISNAREVVGALKQDRFSGIMGELGATAPMVPVSVTVRTFQDNNQVLKERKFQYNVFVQQKWTPFLMMLTVFNTIQQLNDFADESTFRLSGQVDLEGPGKLSLSTMVAPNEAPAPPSLQLAGWWADKFNKLFLNAVQTPKVKSVDAVIDLLPERRIATIESAWLDASDVTPGAEVTGKVFLRPYRGERILREFKVKIPESLPRGEHRLLVSDADTLNRIQAMAGSMNRFLDLPETVALLNKERNNSNLYVSLVENRPTVYYDDKALASLPASMLNVLQSSRSAGRTFIPAPETVSERLTLAFNHVVNGSISLRFHVR